MIKQISCALLLTFAFGGFSVKNANAAFKPGKEAKPYSVASKEGNKFGKDSKFGVKPNAEKDSKFGVKINAEKVA